MSPQAALTGTLPLLLSAKQAGQLLGVSERTFNRMVADGLIPEVVRHPAAGSYTRCRKYSRVQLERYAAGELEDTR
jgi:hypothetical protein